MIATIEHAWRRFKQQPLVPLAILVIGIRVPADPARRTTGSVGVLPVPAPTTPASSVAHNDQATDQVRHDVRAARGRVLYAAGHAPQPTTQRVERKATCTDRRVGQTKTPSSLPNT
jgi:hypothetical protein